MDNVEEERNTTVNDEEMIDQELQSTTRTQQQNELNEDDVDATQNELIENNKNLTTTTTKKSKFKTGVVYLSKIPPGRNYTRLREIFEKFAPIGNIYLVPDKLANDRLQKKGKAYKCYKEGFVEFKRKKDAKNFTNIFNGATLKGSGNTDGFIWDIRYLHRVKWHHIMAKFKHNKALEEQRLRLETEKARETADHYLEMVNEWKRRGNKDIGSSDLRKQTLIEETLTRKQKKTKDELRMKKGKSNNNKKEEEEVMNELYETIFG